MGRGPETGPELEREDEEGDQQFTAESDLRDFLARSLNCVEPGLRLYQVGDRNGGEFPVDGGYIDILSGRSG